MRRLLVRALVAVVLLTGAACDSPTPRASNEVPPPAEVDPAPVVWAALGGDETLAAGGGTLASSWTLDVLDELPLSAELLVLATPSATVADALEVQLPALRASPRPPTVATVWLGAGERSTSESRFRAELVELVERLGEAGVARVVLLSRPDAPTEQGGRFATTIAEVAAATGATHVPIEGVDGSPRDDAGRRRVAEAIAPELTAGGADGSEG